MPYLLRFFPDYEVAIYWTFFAAGAKLPNKPKYKSAATRPANQLAKRTFSSKAVAMQENSKGSITGKCPWVSTEVSGGSKNRKTEEDRLADP